jgi:hypothetical protein
LWGLPGPWRWKGKKMKPLTVVAVLGLSTAIATAMAANTASASDPIPMPRPDMTAAASETGIEERMVTVSAIDPAAPHTPGYGVNDSERVVYPIYFAEGWTSTNDKAEMALRAAAEEITYRGLQDITVAPSDAAMMSSDISAQHEAEKRVQVVADTLEKYGVPERWIAVEPYALPGV